MRPRSTSAAADGDDNDPHATSSLPQTESSTQSTSPRQQGNVLRPVSGEASTSASGATPQSDLTSFPSLHPQHFEPNTPQSYESIRTPSPSAGMLQTPRRQSPSLGFLSPRSRQGSVSTPRTPGQDGFQPTIRIRRFPSVEQVPRVVVPPANTADDNNGDVESPTGRRRSSSEPQRPSFITPAPSPVLTHGSSRRKSRPNLPNIEESPTPTSPGQRASLPTSHLEVPQETPNLGGTSRAQHATPNLARFPTYQGSTAASPAATTEYEQSLVDILDLVDPEVSTLHTLTNVQNSLFIPDLGRFLNRTPLYTLTGSPRGAQQRPAEEIKEEPKEEEPERKEEARPSAYRTQSSMTIASIASTPNDSYYAVLPHGVRLEGWSKADVDELNDHVRHMLHSRRSKFKRGLKGFRQYVRRPLGFFVTLYATLITLFGLAWVLFLIGWINVGGRKDYIINIIDNVLVALFAIMGDGLAPFRTIDTHHMIFIAHYHHLTWRLRREQSLPNLQDHNDLPAAQLGEDDDLEDGNSIQEYSVLNEKQQKRLMHHQKKFSRSHTFYKPHETTTHHAFPLRLLVAVVVLLDCHSLLQIALGTCTWAISYHHRPFALTTVILCCSITCNITAGVLISVGDHSTRKKDVLEVMKLQDLTGEAIKKLEKRKQREKERNQVLDDPLLEEREGESLGETSGRTSGGEEEVERRPS